MTRKIIIILFGIGLMLSSSVQAGHAKKHSQGHYHDHHKKHHRHHHASRHHRKSCRHGHRDYFVAYAQPHIHSHLELGAQFVYSSGGGVVILQPHLQASLGY